MKLPVRTAVLVVAVTLFTALVVGLVAYGFTSTTLERTREQQAYDTEAVLLRDPSATLRPEKPIGGSAASGRRCRRGHLACGRT